MMDIKQLLRIFIWYFLITALAATATAIVSLTFSVVVYIGLGIYGLVLSQREIFERTKEDTCYCGVTYSQHQYENHNFTAAKKWW